jgi:hypothetical protein
MIDQLLGVNFLLRALDPLLGSLSLIVPGFGASLILGTGMGVLLTALAGWSGDRMVRLDRKRHGPTRRMVCRELGLNRHQQRRLESIARQAGLPGAASMLISRGCFNWAVSNVAVPRQFRPELAAVRKRVFDA